MKAFRDHKLTTLAEIPIFGQCHRHELTGLARSFDMSWASPGDVLELEGRLTRWWHVLAHGTATVSHDGRPTGMLTAGDWWGERSILHGAPSTVTVVALTPVVLLTLSRREFQLLAQRHPAVASHVLARLAARRAPYEDLAVA
jgi:CRP-like cAMP-binding protein